MIQIINSVKSILTRIHLWLVVMFYLCGESWRLNFHDITKTSKLSRGLRNFQESPSPRDAKVVFANETDESLRDFWKIVEPRQIRVFIAGEAMVPDLNVFDYAMSFSHMEIDGRHLRLHPSFFFEEAFPPNWVRDASAISPPADQYAREFCDFIYSNRSAHEMRDKLFRAVNDYKEITVLGGHNPLSPESWFSHQALRFRRLSRSPRYLMESKVKLQRGFKFSIVAENARHSGYTSEKILSSLIAGQIPIYWGNPRIADDFNPERFVDASAFGNFNELVEVVRGIDEEPSAWEEMVSKPWYTESQANEVVDSERALNRFLEDVFSASVSNSPRRGVGSFPKIAETRSRRARPGVVSVLGAKFRRAGKWFLLFVRPAGKRLRSNSVGS